MVRWHELEHGLWTCAMDFNNVQTLRETPYGAPVASRHHDATQGLYGRVPMPFPMKHHLAGGLWSPQGPPALPSRIRLDIKPRASQGGLKSFTVSARGPPQPLGHGAQAPKSKMEPRKPRFSIGFESFEARFARS